MSFLLYDNFQVVENNLYLLLITNLFKTQNQI
jgi:hypothetical protein